MLGERLITADPSPYDYTAQVVRSDSAAARARYELASGRIEEGKRLAKKASEHTPKSKEVMNNLGSMLAEFRVFADAIGFFENAIALDSDYFMAREHP